MKQFTQLKQLKVLVFSVLSLASFSAFAMKNYNAHYYSNLTEMDKKSLDKYYDTAIDPCRWFDKYRAHTFRMP